MARPFIAGLFTIGYEQTTVDRVMDALVAARVTHLVDIRAVPISRKPGFSKRQLAAALDARGLRYTHLRGLGTPAEGRHAARRGDTATMTRVFAAHMPSDAAQADLAHAVAIAREDGACLLCFERDHAVCHRRIVADLVCAQTGLAITHLAAALPG